MTVVPAAQCRASIRWSAPGHLGRITVAHPAVGPVVFRIWANPKAPLGLGLAFSPDDRRGKLARLRTLRGGRGTGIMADLGPALALAFRQLVEARPEVAVFGQIGCDATGSRERLYQSWAEAYAGAFDVRLVRGGFVMRRGLEHEVGAARFALAERDAVEGADDPSGIGVRT